MRELLIQHYVKLEYCTFRGTFFIKKNSSIEQLPQKNHKNGSRPKYFNKNTDTYNTASSQAAITRHWTKLNLVRFEDPYYHIKPMDDTHEYTHLIDTQEKNIEDAVVEHEEILNTHMKNNHWIRTITYSPRI